MGQKIQLSESQLRNLIKGSVKKALVKEWRELTASEKEWRDIEQKREDKKRAKENDDAVEKSKFAKKMLAQKSDNESDGKSRTKGDDDKERMPRIRRPLGGKTGNLNEISSDMIGRALDKFHTKYSQKASNLQPKDKRSVWDHESEFANAYNKAKTQETTDDLGRAAYDVFNSIDFSEEFMEGCEGDEWGYEGDGYASSVSTGQVEKDGWKFSFPIKWTSHNGDIMDWDFYGKDSTEVSFISPDGKKGSFTYHTYHPYASGSYKSPNQNTKLTESQLKRIIKESVKKAIMNEISSDMISRASAKLYGKYGWNGTERDKLETDEHGNPLHPKDKKPMAQHFRNFSDAFQRAKRDEQMNDPVTREAMEIWNEVESDVDWDITDDFDNEGCEVTGYIEVDGWEFSATGYAERAGGLNVEEIESVEFKSPDGQEGSFRP